MLIEKIVNVFFKGTINHIPLSMELMESVPEFKCEYYNNIHSILYMIDPLINRWIPECITITMDVKHFIFTDKISSNVDGLYSINVSDVERCWYDKSGISEELKNFLSGIMLCDYNRIFLDGNKISLTIFN